MASATSIHQRRLREFLKEQQEPFILSNYLSERGCSRTWSLQGSANSCLNLNAKLLFSKVLTSLYKKHASHNESSNVIAEEKPTVRDEDVVVRETSTIGDIVVETERFSSSSSSTLFYSCSEIDEDEISLSSDTFQASNNVWPTGMPSQQATNNGKHRWRCKVPSRRASASQNEVAVNEDARKTEKRTHNSCSVPPPKKMREESISSAAIWGLLMQSVKKERGPRKLRDNVAASGVSQGLKSKRVLQKTKKLIFYCAREKLPRKDKVEQCHSKEPGKFICKRTNRSWGQRSRYGGRGLSGLLFSLDDLNSVYGWSDLEAHVEDVILQIGDAILECINNEIVSEFIEYEALV